MPVTSLSSLLKKATKPVVKENNYGVNYHYLSLSEIVLEEEIKNNKEKTIFISNKDNDFRVPVSDRFLSSLNKKTNINQNFFEIFSPQEVVERILDQEGDKKLILTTEKGKETSQALAVIKQEDSIVSIEEALKVISLENPSSISYFEGVLSAVFEPKKSGGTTSIVKEDYVKKFLLEISIDGFSQPKISPMLIRQICTNGAVAEGPMFSSNIILGKQDHGYTIERALKAYNGDACFTHLAERMITAKKSHASLAEIGQFLRILKNVNVPQEKINKIQQVLWSHAGEKSYNSYVKQNGQNPKILRKIASDLNRYSLFNMATEIATHYTSNSKDYNNIQAYVSNLLSRDPDLELSAKQEEQITIPAYFFKEVV
jgi:hypothetical protein